MPGTAIRRSTGVLPRTLPELLPACSPAEQAKVQVPATRWAGLAVTCIQIARGRLKVLVVAQMANSPPAAQNRRLRCRFAVVAGRHPVIQ